MDAKLNSMTKKVFQCFELFRARSAYKFAKTDNMTPTKFFQYEYQKMQNLMPISNH
jgi:hypothetical protein